MPGEAADWIPPSTLEERLKAALLPGRLYIRYKAVKERFRGEPEWRLLRLLVDPKRNAIDAGANKGVYTWALARHARHVYAFEPNPKMLAVLRRTAPANVTVYDCALSNRSGSATLRIPRSKSGYSNQRGSLRAAHAGNAHGAVTVATRRLDELDLPDIGFAKIDVEGFEAEVLEGGIETIRHHRPTLLMEIEQQHTALPIAQSLERVLSLGYRGLFLERGLLRPLEIFDPALHHRQGSADYVFNFIFLPVA